MAEQLTVTQRQCLLTYHGYYKGKVDGIWGQLSKIATTCFQKDFGIPATGICDEATDKALRHAVCYGMPVYEAEEKAESDDFWDNIEYFDREEFRCKCGGKYCKGFPAEPKEKLVRIANDARKHFGNVADVISGLRCEEWNRHEEGDENSQHMYGEACDLRIRGVSADELLTYIKKQPGVRYAYKINDTNVHFDIPRTT